MLLLHKVHQVSDDINLGSALRKYVGDDVDKFKVYIDQLSSVRIKVMTLSYAHMLGLKAAIHDAGTDVGTSLAERKIALAGVSEVNGTSLDGEDTEVIIDALLAFGVGWLLCRIVLDYNDLTPENRSGFFMPEQAST
jgi:hypothetical protein